MTSPVPSSPQRAKPVAVAGGSSFRPTGGGRPKLLGEVWLPVTKVHNPTEKSKTHDGKFDEVLWLHGQRIGRLMGVVRFLNGPSFVQLPGGFFTEAGIVPIAPIAAGGLETQATLAEHGLDDDSENRAGGADALQNFEPAPRGLTLPREVDMLISLVHSLRKVLLDLHLDVNMDAAGGGPDGPLGGGVGGRAGGLSHSDPNDVSRGDRGLAGVLGSRGGDGNAGGWGERLGRSASSDRLTNGEGLTHGEGSGGGGRMGTRSSSVNDRMSEQLLNGRGGGV